MSMSNILGFMIVLGYVLHCTNRKIDSMRVKEWWHKNDKN